MNNFQKRGGKQKRSNIVPNSLGDLVSRAIKDPVEAKCAYEALRSTYLKEVK